MKIQKIVSQHRRDFRAIYICESCDKTQECGGYDDANFHQNVIPKMECNHCGKTSPENYRAMTTKYQDGMVV